MRGPARRCGATWASPAERLSERGGGRGGAASPARRTLSGAAGTAGKPAEPRSPGRHANEAAGPHKAPAPGGATSGPAGAFRGLGPRPCARRSLRAPQMSPLSLPERGRGAPPAAPLMLAPPDSQPGHIKLGSLCFSPTWFFTDL